MGHLTKCEWGAVPASLSDAKGCLAVDVQEYATAQDMMQSTCLKAGYAHTLGFYEVGDGGAAYYTITDQGEPNGMDVLRCEKKYIANLIVEDFLYIEQLGFNSGNIDNFISRGFEIANSIKLLTNKHYNANSLDIGEEQQLCGDGWAYIEGNGTDTTINMMGIKSKIGYLNISNGYDGIHIGSSSNFAQLASIENVDVNHCKNNGIVLVQCNNGTFRGISVAFNGNDGFIFDTSEQANGGANYIEIINSYGNKRYGANIGGEGNYFFICSQSNVQSNIHTTSWMNGSVVFCYTEYSENGYEIEIGSNAQNNVFMGITRSNTNKYYSDIFGLNNTLLLGHGDNNYQPIIPNISTKNGNLLKNFQINACAVYNNETNDAIDIDMIVNSTYTYIADFNGTITKINGKLKNNLTNDNINLTVYKNGTYATHITFNSTSNPIQSTISVPISIGDEITCVLTGFGGTMPKTNICSCTLTIDR